MKRFLIACVMVGALSGSAATLLAHHSFAAEFDDKQPLKLTGTLTKVEWNNPHIWYYVDVKNPDGTTTSARRSQRGRCSVMMASRYFAGGVDDCRSSGVAVKTLRPSA